MNGEDYPDSIPMRIIGWSIDVKWSNGKELKAAPTSVPPVKTAASAESKNS